MFQLPVWNLTILIFKEALQRLAVTNTDNIFKYLKIFPNNWFFRFNEKYELTNKNCWKAQVRKDKFFARQSSFKCRTHFQTFKITPRSHSSVISINIEQNYGTQTGRKMRRNLTVTNQKKMKTWIIQWRNIASILKNLTSKESAATGGGIYEACVVSTKVVDRLKWWNSSS